MRWTASVAVLVGMVGLAGLPARAEMPKAVTNSIAMKLVLVPAGQFMMGSPADEAERRDDEGPQHRVRITRPFYLGAYEVTQDQFEKVMGSNPSRFQGPTRPVDSVTWNEAVEFCRRLGTSEGRTYRLPTEAEWEYACRAGTATAFNSGRTLSFKTDANFNADYAYEGSQIGPYLEKTVPVGSYRPNAWGLYDMHGNVWEWCQDWYASDTYAKSPTDDPAGPASGSYRVDRGGAWNVDAAGSRSAYRDGCVVQMRDDARGFRVVLVAAGAGLKTGDQPDETGGRGTTRGNRLRRIVPAR